MYIPLNGPAVYGNIIANSTSIEVKIGASPLEERTVITIQPLDGNIYYGYDSSVTTSNGTKIYKGQVHTLEATDQLAVWIVSETGTNTNVRVTEVS